MLIFLLPLDALRALGLEPRYVSQFQYDEQLLEKMIRMEGEMDKWEARMNEKLGQITRVTYANLSDLQFTRVKQFIENFKSESGTTPNILFKAKRVHNETTLDNEVIVFKDVLYNFGSGYDSSSGVYTAPVHGTYLFTARLLSKSDGAAFFEINVNGHMHSNGSLFNSKGWSYATAVKIVV
ncbi:uncharacterized protein LOC127857268 [Dreissena polymorpha]|uniref:uncharacterized protein LOC127857268 n=1 Tax=Dreissena polymorpha TaxID=45954 RepID=UPI0022650196|nr:uncharacterized protein LOC127857268 [Dreissena polymorpha]